MSNALSNAHLRFVVFGSPRLERDGRPVPLRRKGLALLGYLAVSGTASRDLLATLLWENWSGRANLRVELHRMAADAGAPFFGSGDDPLELPDWVEVDGSNEAGPLLEGLDGISPSYDAWLEVQRAKWEHDDIENNQAAAVATRLASELQPPFLVMVRVRPMDDLDAFSTALGATLRLPVVQGNGEPAPAVHVVTPPYGDAFQDAILHQKQGVYVVRIPAYGEDPIQLLELRNAYEASRTRFVELPSMTFGDARAGLLRDRPFQEAAEAYLWSGGSVGFLRELARMGWKRDTDGRLALPQRVRAAYQLEIRHASLDARLALERLSVHPGRLSDTLIDQLGAGDAVDELERRGWLVYDGAWRFRDPSARLVIARSLQSGRRAGYHRAVARHFAAEGRKLSAAFHKLAAGEVPELGEVDDAGPGGVSDAMRARLGLDVPGSAPRPVKVVPGDELALRLVDRQGSGLEGAGGHWRIVRWGGESASWATFELPKVRHLLHMSGSSWVDPMLGLGADGDAVHLEIEVGWGVRAVFVAYLREPVVRDGVLLLPLAANLDVWLLLPSDGELRMFSKAEAAVLDLQVTLHEASELPNLKDAPVRQVVAFDVSVDKTEGAHASLARVRSR